MKILPSVSLKSLLALAVLNSAGLALAGNVWLASLDISQIDQGWGEPSKNHSVDGRELSIGGKKFSEGLGTHAGVSIPVILNGRGERFTASVGVDDEVGTQGSVVFKIESDGKTVWESGLMRGGQAAKDVSIDLKGVKTLTLKVEDGGDGIGFDHADWAEAKFAMTSGEPKLLLLPVQREPAVILTPKPSPKPRINSAKIFGVRPGNPFLYTIAATGERPMAFSADHLPGGLNLDSQSGRITGKLMEKGEYLVTLRARNPLGEAERKLKIVCGSTIGLTPAMGWNSWNCFASAVTAEHVKSAADAMVKSGLINHGWTYINIDDYWQVHRDSKDPTLQGPQRDAEGRILPNPRFPDMKGLADYVHNLGLKVGLYSSPGPWTCGGCVGSYQHEEIDARQYGEWGFDYLKYDWCSYGKTKGTQNWPTDEEQRRYELAFMKKPYIEMRAALDRVPRDIMYSLCQYGMGNVWEWGTEVGGNSWRTTGDIVDTWRSLSEIGFNQAGKEKFAVPGHFNDPDMLIVGKVGWGPRLHPTRLTPNEQYTHISLWCLLASPLLIGCDMTQLDDFTLNLLTNDEVLEVNQDPLGKQAARVATDGKIEIWAKDLEDGSKAVGLFNRGETEMPAAAQWADLGLSGKQTVRDLWRQKDIGTFEGKFQVNVPRHGVMLVKISK